MNIPFLGRAIDERFWRHRLRSTSIAGIASIWVAMGIFLYRYYFQHVANWDLIIVGVTAGAVKIALLSWYLITD